MTDTTIRIENLGKKYILHHQQKERYATLRDVMASIVTSIGEKLQHLANKNRADPTREEFWALQNVSFNVRRGEVIGIIGRNGAGKSTLLKILSRITEPTVGRVHLKGRVASLLEVGTGFHPELSGRENIFLNGAILGMSKAEIKQKFDEIVAFSEIGKFLDTPVKRYSSGMKVRLGFAVAAHLEPEILLVDEVLAVGDAAFRQKCLDKMSRMVNSGRTIFFVSHNMSAIQSICERVIWIDSGEIKMDGHPQTIVDAYLAQSLETKGQRADSSPILTSIDESLEIKSVQTRDENGRLTNCFRTGSPITIELSYYAKRPILRPYLFISIMCRYGSLFGANMLLDGFRPDKLIGDGQIRCTFNSLPLLPKQTYGIKVGGRQENGSARLFEPAEIAQFKVEGSAKEIGFSGQLAETVIATSTPALVPYTWQMPDGHMFSVDPFQTRNSYEQASQSHKVDH